MIAKSKQGERKRNIRTLPANRMIYLLENYPADVNVLPDGNDARLWTESQVLRAMQAAFNAGRRSRNES